MTTTTLPRRPHYRAIRDTSGALVRRASRRTVRVTFPEDVSLSHPRGWFVDLAEDRAELLIADMVARALLLDPKLRTSIPSRPSGGNKPRSERRKVGQRLDLQFEDGDVALLDRLAEMTGLSRAAVLTRLVRASAKKRGLIPDKVREGAADPRAAAEAD